MAPAEAKWEKDANDPTFDNCALNLADYSNVTITDGTYTGLPSMNECKGSDANKYKSFKQYNHSDLTNKITGHCCYIPFNLTINGIPQGDSNDKSCGIDPSFSQVSSGSWKLKETDSNNPDISNNFDFSYIMCGIKSNSDLGKTFAALDNVNVETFIIYIIGIFISVLIYAVFVVGPFLFWVKYAPRVKIETGCHAPKSLLERYYEFNDNELPYEWELLEGCKSPPKELIPSLDKCPDTHGMYSENKLGSVGGSVWDRIVYHIGGFPYYGIISHREEKYKKYSGNLFIITIIISILLCCMVYGPFFPRGEVAPRDWPNTFGCGFGALALILSSPVAILKWFNYEEEIVNKFWKRYAIFIGFSIIMYVLNTTIFKKKTPIVIINTIIIGILYICTGAYLGEHKRNSSEKLELGFMEAIEKGLYYLRKVYINIIKYSLRGGRWTVYHWFDFIGKWPIPDWIYIIFGKILIPVLVGLAMFFRCFMSFGNSFRGVFGHFSSTNSTGMVGGGKLTDTRDYVGRKLGSASSSVSSGMTSAAKATKTALYNAPSNIAKGIKMGIANRPKRKSFETGIMGILSLFTPFAILIPFMPFINALFFFFSYHFIPLTYPKIILNILSCNIHTFGAIFGLGVIGLCWALIITNKSPFPKEVVIAMTVTFALLVIHNLFTKK
jgi:hypothetical protein